MNIKNARSNIYWRAFARLFQMVDVANMRIYFGLAKGKPIFLNIKKFRSPLLYTLRKTVGALTLHTGRNYKTGIPETLHEQRTVIHEFLDWSNQFILDAIQFIHAVDGNLQH